MTSPFRPSVKFQQYVSEDRAAAAFDVAEVGIALNEKAEAELLNEILVASWLCEMRLRGSCKENSTSSDRHQQTAANCSQEHSLSKPSRPLTSRGMMIT